MGSGCAKPAAASRGPGGRVRVLLPIPVPGPYDYTAPDGLSLAPGDIVEAPLGSRLLPGVVWDAAPTESGPRDLKALRRRFDVPPLPTVLQRLVDWVAAYYVQPPGAVLKMALSVPAALEPPPARVAYRRAAADPASLGLRLTPARRRVLDALEDGAAQAPGALAAAAACSPGVLRGLAEAGALDRVPQPAVPPVAPPDLARPGPALSADQQAAATALATRAEAGGFGVTLLDGVTGSGKTEVYFAAVRAALAQGQQALVLLPEIALSRQWLQRFEARFGAAPALWHSELSPAQRRETWRAVAEGTAPVVVGARSALFLPYPDLGVVIVDEEHDPAFKQEDGVPYNARDMAVVRARLGDHPAVLVSATPALESIQNVAAGRYARQHLPERHAGAVLPRIETVDLRRDRPTPIPGHGPAYLAPTLRTALAETLAAGEQAMLFLNRRGFAPLTLCRSCGHRLQCPNCTAWLVEHRLRGCLQCHHCGHAQAVPSQCPACGEADSLAACGPGVERVAAEVAALFPEARTALLASDTLTGPGAAARLLDSVYKGDVDILIGTQVVAKGHHFPGLTLVGVVDADLGLSGGDLRAGERTYQLLHQVAGRAGRAAKPGRALLQTYEPGHEVLQALVAQDRDRFLKVEAEHRRRAGMPPFARLVALIVAGPSAEAADALARDLARTAPAGDGLEVLGPAPAPLAVLRGRHRRRLLLRTRRDLAPQPLLRRWLDQVQVPSRVRLYVDVDPYSFL